MNEKMNKYCAIALEIARRFMEIVTGDVKVGRFISSIPMSYSISSNAEAEVKDLIYKTYFYFPKHDRTIMVAVTLHIVEDRQKEPYITGIKAVEQPVGALMAHISIGSKRKLETADTVDFTPQMLGKNIMDEFEAFRFKE